MSSHTTGLGVIRALGSMGVTVDAMYYDDMDMGFVSRFVRRKIQVCRPELDHALFVDALLAYAKRHGRRLPVPADDASLRVVSRNRALLQRHLEVACMDWSSVGNLLDWNYTCDLLGHSGIPLPVPARVATACRHGQQRGPGCDRIW